MDGFLFRTDCFIRQEEITANRKIAKQLEVSFPSCYLHSISSILSFQPTIMELTFWAVKSHGIFQTTKQRPYRIIFAVLHSILNRKLWRAFSKGNKSGRRKLFSSLKSGLMSSLSLLRQLNILTIPERLDWTRLKIPSNLHLPLKVWH